MADGFQMNAGVPDRNQRENPPGVSGMGQLPNIGVPTNVPIVMPSRGDMTSNIQPDSGAMSLAQTLGNINFGSLATAFTTRNQMQRKLKDEQESANSQAEVAGILAKTGQDYGTLVRAGKIPLYKTPNAQLGGSIAGAKAVFMQMYNDVLARRAENPEAPIFTQDAEFMSKYMSQLNGVRNEAVVKYFLDPMDAVAQDDMKGLVSTHNEKFKFKLESDTTTYYQNAVKAGASPGAAANDAFTQLKLAQHLDDKTSSALIKTAATEIAASVYNPVTGQMDISKATRQLMELGATKLDAFGGNLLRDRFSDEFMKARSIVFQAATEAASADKTQREAAALNSQSKFIEWLGSNYSKTTPEKLIQQGIQFGMKADDAMQTVKAYGGLDDVKSQGENAKDQWAYEQAQQINGMAPGQLDKEWEYNDRAVKEGVRSYEQGLKVQQLITAARSNHKSAPIPSEDQKAFTKSVKGALPALFKNSEEMSRVLNSAAMKLGYRMGDANSVAGDVADYLTRAGIPWIQSDSQRMDTYQALQGNIQQDQTGPSRFVEKSARDMINLHRQELYKQVVEALYAPTGDQIRSKLAAISLHHQQVSQPTNVYRNTQPQPASRFPNIQKVQQQQPKANVTSIPAAKPAAANPTIQIKETAAAYRELLDTKSPVHQWYANHIRAKHPGYSDHQIILRINNLTPDARYKLKQMYLKEHKNAR